jgi:DNA-binding MarR family transcriptional regulator
LHIVSPFQGLPEGLRKLQEAPPGIRAHAGSEIGKRLVLDNATLSGVLDRLADGGWIIKTTADDDKRLLQIYLTPKAKEMAGVILKERDGLNEDILSPLKQEEKLLLKRMLKDLQ